MEYENEIHTLTAQLVDMKTRLRQVALEKEIFLESKKVSIERLSEYLLLDFDSEHLCLALIHVQADPATRHHPPVTVETENPAGEPEILYYSQDAIRLVSSLCQNRLSPEHNCFVFPADRDIAILLCPKPQYISGSRIRSGNYLLELKWKLSQLLLELDKQLSFPSIITLSSIAEGSANLRQLYLENVCTYDYLWDNLGGVHSYLDLKPTPMSAKDLTELNALEQEFMVNVTRTLYHCAATTLRRILELQMQQSCPCGRSWTVRPCACKTPWRSLSILRISPSAIWMSCP